MFSRTCFAWLAMSSTASFLVTGSWHEVPNTKNRLPHRTTREVCAYEARASMDDFQGAHGATSALITDDFVAAVMGDRPSPIDMYDALDMTLPGLCAVQSIEEGRTVEIPDLR